MKVGLAQMNPTVGDLAANAAALATAYDGLVAGGADIVLSPELALTGYPPQDLVFKSRFVPDAMDHLRALHHKVGRVPLIVGSVVANPGRGRPFHNAAVILERDQPVRMVFKTLLPTYDVFDEARYFEPAASCQPLDLAGLRCGVTICEDIWTSEFLPRPLYARDPVSELAAGGARVVFNLSASPFHPGKPAQREQMVRAVAVRHALPILYCNAVGGNDQLVFDGNSFAVGPTGQSLARLPAFAAATGVVDLASSSNVPPYGRAPLEDLHDALVLGIRDYMAKCGFSRCVLGLSGGIDSALTACLAVAAVGPENVTGVAMPTAISSSHSVEDAEHLARALALRHLKVPIEGSFRAFRDQMAEVFHGLPEDTTEENMQARLRGLTLMSLSNKFGTLLLTTGNKSELAVGYCTLYGDMCGGLAAISDVPKTVVYELAKFINSRAAAGTPPIPRRTIEKPPSAELRPNQKDQDTLPPYDVLDAVLRLYVEENLSAADIIARGMDAEVVKWIIRRVDLNEYKRAQAAPGLKVTARAFGRGRRMPIAQNYVG